MYVTYRATFRMQNTDNGKILMKMRERKKSAWIGAVSCE